MTVTQYLEMDKPVFINGFLCKNKDDLLKQAKTFIDKGKNASNFSIYSLSGTIPALSLELVDMMEIEKIKKDVTTGKENFEIELINKIINNYYNFYFYLKEKLVIDNDFLTAVTKNCKFNNSALFLSSLLSSKFTQTR